MTEIQVYGGVCFSKAPEGKLDFTKYQTGTDKFQFHFPFFIFVFISIHVSHIAANQYSFQHWFRSHFQNQLKIRKINFTKNGKLDSSPSNHSLKPIQVNIIVQAVNFLIY